MTRSKLTIKDRATQETVAVQFVHLIIVKYSSKMKFICGLAVICAIALAQTSVAEAQDAIR